MTGRRGATSDRCSGERRFGATCVTTGLGPSRRHMPADGHQGGAENEAAKGVNEMKRCIHLLLGALVFLAGWEAGPGSSGHSAGQADRNSARRRYITACYLKDRKGGCRTDLAGSRQRGRAYTGRLFQSAWLEAHGDPYHHSQCR